MPEDGGEVWHEGELEIYKVGAKKIMKTNDFYKTINGIESFF